VVKEAFTIENGRRVQHAVKIVRKHAMNEGNEILQSHFEREVSIWKCLSNRYILPLLSVFENGFAVWAFTLLFQGGTLFDVFKNFRQGLPPSLALKYSFQLGSALRYLHQDAHVVHRDIKLENCVLDRPYLEGGDLRLCDFGLADFLPGEDTPCPQERFTNLNGELRPDDMVVGGSLAYAAPEQVQSVVPLLNTAMDMWSYGVVVHALAIGELPFHEPFAPKLQMLIIKGKWNQERLGMRVDNELFEVVDHCLEMDFKKRWSASDVLKSQWISYYNGDQ
jgi:serine/threonine protein kinase